MYSFKNITPTNGFDFDDLDNARQNNYAWSMAELDGYIYVGTGRNIPLTILQSIASNPGFDPPFLLKPKVQDNLAEIWRYKKDGSLPWKRVYKAKYSSKIVGFRFMISYKPFKGSPCLIVAGYGSGPRVKVLKSTNGCDWFDVSGNDPNTLLGTSSRAMVVINDKLYIATVDDNGGTQTPYLYRSKDPEYFNWEPVTPPSPNGAISNMALFNNKLYIAISSSDGAEVWRTEGEEPNGSWVKVVDKGFGDAANKYTLSIGVFKDYLYVSGTKQLPLAWAIPLGCDIIRIDKNDKWELVVGGRPLIPSEPYGGPRGESISGLGSGFNNPFNVYAWQIQEYNGELLISTFDDSSNMQVILDTLLGNIPSAHLLIGIYKTIVKLLAEFRYPIGFDLYVSRDGKTFKRIVKRGLKNPNNYGGRMLFVDSDNDLYLGTANPFEGCEVWKNIYRRQEDHFCDYTMNESYHSELNTDLNENYYNELGLNLNESEEEMVKQFNVLEENLDELNKFLPKQTYHNFTND